jgi:hypothetical protein
MNRVAHHRAGPQAALGSGKKLAPCMTSAEMGCDRLLES